MEISSVSSALGNNNDYTGEVVPILASPVDDFMMIINDHNCISPQSEIGNAKLVSCLNNIYIIAKSCEKAYRLVESPDDKRYLAKEGDLEDSKCNNANENLTKVTMAVLLSVLSTW